MTKICSKCKKQVTLKDVRRVKGEWSVPPLTKDKVESASIRIISGKGKKDRRNCFDNYGYKRNINFLSNICKEVKMTRKIEGTNKFIVYLYNGKMVRGGSSKPKHFVYRQWGRVFKLDENNKQVGTGFPFTDYGEMITQINKIMRKSVMKNLKCHRTWD